MIGPVRHWKAPRSVGRKPPEVARIFIAPPCRRSPVVSRWVPPGGSGLARCPSRHRPVDDGGCGRRRSGQAGVMTDREAPRVAGYDVTGLLGAGSGGEVWLGRDRGTGEQVALKRV